MIKNVHFDVDIYKQEIQKWKKRSVEVGKDIPECGTVEDYENSKPSDYIQGKIEDV